MLAGKLIATVGMIAYAAMTLQAQWQVTTNRVPMTPDGKPTRTKCFLCQQTKWLRSFKAY